MTERRVSAAHAAAAAPREARRFPWPWARPRPSTTAAPPAPPGGIAAPVAPAPPQESIAPPAAPTLAPLPLRGPRRWLPFRQPPATRAEPGDPLLLLARDWLLARGGRLVRTAPDLVAGALPGGSLVAWTHSAARAGREPGLTLLAPGASGLDALLAAVARRGDGLALRAIAVPQAPESLARAALAAPDPACPACAGLADEAIPHSPACPIHQGSVVVGGLAGGARAAVVERRTEEWVVEHVFRLAVTSPQGRRAELVRLAVAVESGAACAPLAPDALGRAVAVEHAPPPDAVARARVAAEHLLEPPALAAARLARLQVLPEYQRRQRDIAVTYERLLVETPEDGLEVLRAREHALALLAASHAVDLETEPLAVAAVLTPLAAVRLRLAGDAALDLKVDLARGTIRPPACPACAAPWRAGARCAEGHVTCLACQRRCAHCGARHCRLCAAPPPSPCPTCGLAACPACARAAARGHHPRPARALAAFLSAAGAPGELPAPISAARSLPDAGAPPSSPRRMHGLPPPDARAAAAAPSPRTPGSRPPQGPQDEPAGLGPDDLCPGDLDAMTPTSWRSCVAWLAAGMGYAVERELAADDLDPALVCHRDGPARVAPPSLAAADRPERLVLAGCRPGPDAQPPARALARLAALAAGVPGARPFLLTTGRAGSPADPGDSGTVEIVDRSGLERLLAAHTDPDRRERTAADVERDARMAAAAAVRATMIAAAVEAADLLGAPAADAAHGGDGAPAAPPEAPDPADDGMAPMREAARVALQALAALETLAGGWEGCFAPVPDRDGSLICTAGAERLAALGADAEHLRVALRAACVALAGTSSGGGRGMSEWRAAVMDEVRLGCEALARRCQALDPAAWRSFAAAHDDVAARAGVAAAEAARRAGLRARALLDALQARGQDAPATTPPRPP